jgi:hypothetical protein
MDESSDKSPDSGDGADKKTEAKAVESNLPVVWSPKLYIGAGFEDDAASLGAEQVKAAPADEAAQTRSTDHAANEPAAAAATPRSRRFALLAATVAVAAALGSFVGALTVSGLGRLASESAPATDIADASVILRALKSQVAELTALKSSLDGSVRNANAQFATIADRLDRVERAAANPSTQLAHIAETVDRLARINASPETTSSIASGAAPVEPKITDRIVADWVVQDVRGDRALVENRNGGLFEIGAGSVLPGLGRVEGVKRQDGQWVVLTARGVITSGR